MKKENETSCDKISMSCPKFFVGHLPMFLSNGTVVKRNERGRCRTAALRHDNFFDNGNNEIPYQVRDDRNTTIYN